jgi:hypothetical protein
MNSPLEIRKVRLRGLPQPGRFMCTGTRLFKGSEAASVHKDGARQEPSAKADTTFSEPRIHSPGLGRGDYRI